MKVTDYIASAYLGRKGRKRIQRTISVLIFLAVLFYLVINSMSSSVHKMADMLNNIPISVTLVAEDDETQSLYYEMKEAAKKDEEIIDVYPFVEQIGVTARGIQADKEFHMAIQSYSQGMEKYLVQGDAPADGGILIPKYLYGFDTGERYIDGDKLIGKQITVEVINYRDEVKEQTYYVSGTYDNIYMVSENNLMFLAPGDAYELQKVVKEGAEELKKKYMKESGDYDESHYIGFGLRYQCAVYVDQYSHLEEVKNRYSQAAWKTYVISGENTIDSMFQFIRFVGNIIVIVLLSIGVISIVIMILNDIDGRQQEIAVFNAMGYRRRTVVWIFSLEYLFGIIKSMVLGIVISYIVIYVQNIFIEKVMSMEYGVLKMSMEIRSATVTVLILLFLFFFVIYQCYIRIKNINISEALKLEE